MRLTPFRLGAWRVIPSLNRLTIDDQTVHLEPKLMEVLVRLAMADGHVVSRDEFMDEVWGDTIVSNDVLFRCISELRKIFGDDAAEPEYIETIRKTGYRLLKEVEFEEPAAKRNPVANEKSTNQNKTRPTESLSARPGDDRISTRKFLLAEGRLRPLAWTILGGSVMGLIFMVVQFFTRDSGAPSQVVPFTTFPGEEIDPDLSPDGESIAFAWNGGAGDNFDLYIKQIGGEAPLRLTEAPGDERNPAWSADGKQIAFVRELDGTSSVYVVPGLGGNERLIAAFKERSVQDIIWSPSGAYIAVSVQSTPYSAYSISLLSITTLDVQTLTSPPPYFYGDTSPAFSPDEKEVAFVRGITAKAGDIYSIEMEGGDLKRLTFDYAQVSGIDWDHDTNHLLFASDRDGASNIWQMTARGGQLQWIMSAGDNADLRKPSMANGGSRLLIFERASSNTNIWQLRRAKAPTRIIASTRWESNPGISPDGQQIAYISNQSGSYELWVCDADSKNAFQLNSQGKGFMSMPAWSPDGEEIAYVSWNKESADINIIKSTGGSPRVLIGSVYDELSPRWSRDGEYIYFATNRNQRWQVWAAGTKAPEDLDSDVFDFAEADSIESLQAESEDSLFAGTDSLQALLENALLENPEQPEAGWLVLDEAFVAVEANEEGALLFVKPNEPGIWLMPAERDTVTQVLESLLPADKDNWSVAGNGLYFIRRDGSRPAVAYHNLLTGRTTQIAVLDHLPEDHSFAVSPDGTWFLFSQEENRESDILILDNVARR